MQTFLKIDGTYYRKLGQSLYGRYFISGINGKVGIIDENTTTIQPPIYREIVPAFKGHFWGRKEERFYLYDFSGTQISDESLLKVFPFVMQYAGVSSDGRTFGFVDRQGAWVIPPKYEEGLFLGLDYFLVRNDDNYGVIDKQKKIIIPFSDQPAPTFSMVISTLLKQRRPLRHWLYYSEKSADIRR